VTPFGFKNIQRALVIGPHPDDVEFSAAGTITKFIEHGIEVVYAVFSMCEKSTPAGFEVGVIEKELDEASQALGIKPQNLIKFNYEVRCFPQYRQEILEDMVKLNKDINPDLVFLPCSSDIHQDHKTVHEEGIRAFKTRMIVGYEMPWNNLNFLSNLHVALEERHVKKKIEVLDIYQSQKHRYYSNEEFVMSLAKIRGIQIRTPFAEAFEVMKWKIE
jgi:LmbE family N-acetylglucosaminyl deacetylase